MNLKLIYYYYSTCMAIWLLLTGLFLFGPLFLSGQKIDWEFEPIEMPGGLGGNKVQSIIQDRRGYLWIGSQNGLHRFDGKSFKSFVHNPLDSNSISDDYIECLYEDKNGYIWIGTVGNGLNRLDPKTEKFSRYFDEILDRGSGEHTSINSIAEDKEGNIWIASLSGVSRYNIADGSFKKYRHNPNDPNSLSNNLANLVYNDRSGNLWIGTGFFWFSGNGGGLNRYVPEKDHFIRYQHDPEDPKTLSHNCIWSIEEDQEGHFWVGTGGGEGLHLMDRTNGTFTHFPFRPDQPQELSAPNTKALQSTPSVGLRRIMEDRAGRLWLLGFDRGLSIYNPKLQSLSFYPLEHHGATVDFLPADKTFNVMEAQDGSIWLSSGSSGPVIRALPRNNFLNYYDLADYGVGVTQLRKLYEDKQSNIWLGLSQGKFMQFKPDLSSARNFENTTYPKGAPSAGAMRVIFEDQSDKIWIGINNRIEYFEPVTKHFHPIDIPLPTHYNIPTEQPIYALNQDKNGDFWIGTLSWGLFRYDAEQDSLEHFNADLDRAQKLGGRSISNIFKDQQEQVWVSGGNIPIFVPTLDEGFLDQWSEEHQVFIHHLPNGDKKILGRMPMSIEEDRDSTLWFVSWGGGLHAYSPKTGQLDYFNPAIGNFPDWDTRWLVIDKEKNLLWIGTRHDVYRFDPTTFQYEKFSLFNGKAGESNHGKALMKKSGQILFAWGNGFYQFDPQKYELERSGWQRPHVILADLYVNEKKTEISPDGILRRPLSETRKISLKHSENRFGIEIHNFHFIHPELNRMEYRLDPYDPDWQTGSDQIARYNQVLPGQYTFSARGYSSEGLRSETVSLDIEILPPWWQSSWAYILYGLTGLFVLAAIYNYQRRRWQLQTKLQLEQEKALRLTELDSFKSRFYTNITHEFRTPLTVIKGMAEQISGNEKIKNLIRRNSNRLLSMVNQLLDLSKLETNSLAIKWIQGDIIPYLQYLTESCHSLAESKKLNLAFFAKDNSLIMDFDEDKLQQILINLLSNAIKFTPEYGSVKVIVTKVKKQGNELLQLEVRDTGRGIPAEKIPHVFDRFYQVDDSATRQGEGSGIGLALVQELVHLLKGRIEVNSEMDKGSSFKVYLPVHQKAEQKLLELEIRSEPILAAATIANGRDSELIEVGSDSDKPLILIIEDNADVVEYIVSCLQGDYQLQTAPNGRIGIDKALEIIPDVILCDVMMPEMDGFEVCRRLKEAAPTSHIPIVLLTAKATQEDKLTGLSRGADAYLTKPFDKQELLIRLENLSRLSQQLQERLSHPIDPQEGINPREAKEAAFLKDLRQIVDTHLADETFDTTGLCRAIAMSRTQLHRKLKALTGQSTAQYIRSARMQHARVLLQETDLPIGAIASQVGFKDFSHFSKTFLKAFGVSPSGFRDKTLS